MRAEKGKNVRNCERKIHWQEKFFFRPWKKSLWGEERKGAQQQKAAFSYQLSSRMCLWPFLFFSEESFQLSVINWWLSQCFGLKDRKTVSNLHFPFLLLHYIGFCESPSGGNERRKNSRQIDFLFRRRKNRSLLFDGRLSQFSKTLLLFSDKNGSSEVLSANSEQSSSSPASSRHPEKECKMKLTTTTSVEDVNDLLSKKSENVFYKETKPRDTEGGGVCVCILLILSRTDQRVHECDAE